MRTRAAILVAAVLVAALPLAAQRRGGMSGRARMGNTSARAQPLLRGRPSFPTHARFNHRGLNHRTFRHGFGFGFGVPVFGLGFDAHHFSILHRRRGFGHHRFAHQPFVSPGFFPFTSAVSTTVVVVPQVVPVAVPVDARGLPVQQSFVPYVPPKTQPSVPRAERLVGTPRAEERLRVVPPGLRGEPPPPPRFTLLVFKNHSIYAATDYWLEGGQLHYVTSYGAQNAVPFEQIDLEMTVQLNWERGVEFTLRPEPASPEAHTAGRFGTAR